MSVVEETRRSIAAAVADGTVDPEVSAGPIAAVLLVAEQLDHEDFPVIQGKLDNVSLPTYLRYCAELHLTPASTSAKDKKQEGGGGTKLALLQDAQRKRAA